MIEIIVGFLAVGLLIVALVLDVKIGHSDPLDAAGRKSVAHEAHVDEETVTQWRMSARNTVDKADAIDIARRVSGGDA